MGDHCAPLEALFLGYLCGFLLAFVELSLCHYVALCGRHSGVYNLLEVMDVAEALDAHSGPYRRFLGPHGPTVGTRPATALVGVHIDVSALTAHVVGIPDATLRPGLTEARQLPALRAEAA